MKDKSQTKVDPDYGKSVVTFVGDIKKEFKKVTWTPKEELIVYTKAVVGATFILGIGTYFIDVLIQNSLALLNMALRVITG